MSLLATQSKPEKRPACPSWAKRYFFTGEAPDRDSSDREAYVRARWLPGGGLKLLWARHREALLGEWAAKHPGTRPPWWWRREAPELRRVLPGQGVVSDESPHFYLEGIPGVFPEAPAELVFEGKAKIESEAAYLRRLKLLASGEAKRVKRTAFRPELVDFSIEGRGLSAFDMGEACLR